MAREIVTFDRDRLGIPARSGRQTIECIVHEAGCFECVSHGKGAGGYPHISVKGRWPILSRIVYAATFGPIADGLLVRHDCDNPCCINPDHLRLGTGADNSRDCKERGRNNRGSRNGQATLTEEQVAEIKQMDGLWNYQIAALFGVSHSLIALIKTGQYWQHVTVENPAPPTTKARPGPKGATAKLSREDIEAIRAAPGYSTGGIAERFGISKTQFYRIKRGDLWPVSAAGEYAVECGGSGKRSSRAVDRGQAG